MIFHSRRPGSTGLVICPQCKAENGSWRRTCKSCGHKLIAKEGWLSLAGPVLPELGYVAQLVRASA
jgi:predicted amidophosphoribosyltransferase